MINMNWKYDQIYRNDMSYALKCTDNHVISTRNCMLSLLTRRDREVIDFTRYRVKN